MTLSDRNTDLALASNQFWPLWQLQSFKTAPRGFWRLLLRPAWACARLHLVQSREGAQVPLVCNPAHAVSTSQTHTGNRAGGHFLGGEWCSCSAALPIIFICGELYRHCQLQKEIRWWGDKVSRTRIQHHKLQHMHQKRDGKEKDS